MFEIGDYVLAKHRYGPTNASLVIAIMDDNELYMVSVDNEVESSWKLDDEHWIRYPNARRATNIASFNNTPVYWWLEKDLQKVAVKDVLIIDPLGTTYKKKILPKLDIEIIINKQLYIVSEISEDKETVWVDNND